MGMMQRNKRARREYDGKARFRVLKGREGLVVQSRAVEHWMRAAMAARVAVRQEALFQSPVRALLGRDAEWAAQGQALMDALSAK